MNVFQRDFHIHSKGDKSPGTGDGHGSAQPHQNKWGPENPPVHNITVGQRRGGSCPRVSKGLQQLSGHVAGTAHGGCLSHLCPLNAYRWS